MVKPAFESAQLVGPVDHAMDSVRRHLTEEENCRGLAALERIVRLNKEISARRGGEPFPDSCELINQSRGERSKQLS